MAGSSVRGIICPPSLGSIGFTDLPNSGNSAPPQAPSSFTFVYACMHNQADTAKIKAVAVAMGFDPPHYFGRSVTPTSARGDRGQIMHTTICPIPRICRPSYGPVPSNLINEEK